jgi:alpha-tubulin suppressor-like RCC1 family protein
MKRLVPVLLILLAACPANTGDDTADDDGTGVDAPPPPPGPEVLDISAGSGHTCALLGDRTVRCWGDNREGQLGDGTTTSSVRPVTVVGLSGVGTVVAGHEHTCAVLEDGTARCWGRNANGQLGDGTKVDSETPVTVTGLAGIRSIHPGVSITCALTIAGRVHCWGRGGELGDGTVTEALTPRAITALTNVSQLSVSSNGGRSTNIHACGVRVDGTAFCWGANDDGQCGNGMQGIATTPVEVSGVDDAIEITAGGGHACVRRTAGVACWGASQLVGDGTVQRRLVPTPITTPASVVVELLAGNNFTLGQGTDGALFCWGESGSGQCGDGAAFTPGGPVYLAPVGTLSTHSRTVLYNAGGVHACAYVSTGTLTTCWGSNDFGELGSGVPGSGVRTSTPQPVVW